jgi:hypothetical protein
LNLRKQELELELDHGDSQAKVKEQHIVVGDHPEDGDNVEPCF